MAMTEEGLTFFFREYARLKRLLNKHKIVDTEDALIRASENGKLHIVALLLEADADANVRDQSQGTALIAASYSGHTEVVAELLKYKADTDLQDDGGHTALFFACDKGHMDICTLLVEAGASLNEQDCRGNTGLTMAAYIGHIDVCHLLVGGGEYLLHCYRVFSTQPLSLSTTCTTSDAVLTFQELM
jgi:ankyrin repeat protein